MFDEGLLDQARQLVELCRRQALTMACAESCTGGLIAGLLTSVPGASEVLERGFVTYANQAKVDLLGIDPALLQAHGAVSEPVAIAMAEGALRAAPVQITLSVTGIAGPGGATPDKPVGLVHMAAARQDFPTLHERHIFDGDRNTVRLAAVAAALALAGRQLAR